MTDSVPEPLPAQVETLQKTDPAKYGLLAKYHSDIRQGIEACPYSYPCTKQFRPTLENQALTPQMVGNLLSLLVQLGVLTTYSDRSNSNRYDLTRYDAARMGELTVILEKSPAGDGW